MTYPWINKIGNISQIGGIETSVLDNGPAGGCRIAWVNTGSGLRYKVAIDRCLDIVDAFYDRHSLVWLSHAGLTAARPDANAGLEWLYTFAGGLMTTCGLTHTGGPESDKKETRGLHGRISNMAATLESVIQPDPAAGKMDMSITAVVKESSIFGPQLQMRRTIRSTLGQATINICDEVVNRGNTPCPHMILYHCNFGWPLVDENALIVYSGTCRPSGPGMDNAIFDGPDYKKCRKPMDSHRAGGEACGFIDARTDAKGICTIGLANPQLNLALAMKYKKQQMPGLTNWQHWGPGEYVCALEPGTNPPIGQNRARETNTLTMLAPAEKRQYELEFSVLTDTDRINEFIRTAD